MSDNFNHTAYALHPAVLSEDPFGWDWAALKKEVDESFAGSVRGDWYQEITLESLQEEPLIAGWWDVQVAPTGGPQDATSHARPLIDKDEQRNR